MLKELLISIVSGVVVAVLLQIFHIGGGGGSSNAPRQTMYNAPPPARRSGGGGFFRFVFAVIGGLVLAYVAAPFVLEMMHGGRGGGFGRGRYFDSGYYDRGGGGVDGIFGLPPLLVLTIIGTIIIWVLLSAMRRR